LKLATFYEIEDGRDYAISTLHGRPDLRPAMRLYLAQNYLVTDWICPGFQQLVATPTLSLTDNDIEHIGSATFIVLVRTKARIDLHRRACAVRAPPVTHGDGCYDEEECEKEWQNAWWGEQGRPGVAITLVHPNLALPAKDIARKLDTLKLGWKMDDSCRDLTVEKVRGVNLKGPLMLEDEYVEEAIAQLTMMYGC
jgi:hypothetical protein